MQWLRPARRRRQLYDETKHDSHILDVDRNGMLHAILERGEKRAGVLLVLCIQIYCCLLSRDLVTHLQETRGVDEDIRLDYADNFT